MPLGVADVKSLCLSVIPGTTGQLHNHRNDLSVCRRQGKLFSSCIVHASVSWDVTLIAQPVTHPEIAVDAIVPAVGARNDVM